MISQKEINDKIEKRVSRIDKIIAIMSGKGGVGKSVVTGLIGSYLSKSGKRVGILDADVTGSSIPKIFGLKEKPTVVNNEIIPPKTKSGIKIISTGLLTESENEPIVWRGPLIANTIRQFVSDVKWEDLDYLLVDLPPGTSDAPVTVLQILRLYGVIIVTSPQDLVSVIVERAIKMSRMLNTKILGLIENMSWIKCPYCGRKIELFGTGKTEELAKRNNIKVLGRIPIDPKLSLLCDEGRIEEYKNEVISNIVGRIE